jgi:hypothetical protein
VVVEAEFSGTKKITLRSEWSNAPKKQKKNENKRRKIQKRLDRAGTVKDAWLAGNRNMSILRHSELRREGNCEIFLLVSEPCSAVDRSALRRAAH